MSLDRSGGKKKEKEKKGGGGGGGGRDELSADYPGAIADLTIDGFLILKAQTAGKIISGLNTSHQNHRCKV